MVAETKQDEFATANEHMKNCNTPDQGANSTNKTVKLNTCMAAARTNIEMTRGNSSRLVRYVHLKMANYVEICSAFL
jgi:hypothetical protein